MGFAVLTVAGWTAATLAGLTAATFAGCFFLSATLADSWGLTAVRGLTVGFLMSGLATPDSVGCGSRQISRQTDLISPRLLRAVIGTEQCMLFRMMIQTLRELCASLLRPGWDAVLSIIYWIISTTAKRTWGHGLDVWLLDILSTCCGGQDCKQRQQQAASRGREL